MTQTTEARVFTPEQARRYSRHIIMPQIGGKGQRRLLDAKVLLIGAGGWVRLLPCIWRRREWGRWAL